MNIFLQTIESIVENRNTMQKNICKIYWEKKKTPQDVRKLFQGSALRQDGKQLLR